MSTKPAPATETPRREGRALVWALMIAALVLLTLAAGLKAQATKVRNESAKASRIETFNASGDLKSLSVETVNGRVDVTAGPAFRAEVEVTAWGPDDATAKKRLADVKVRFENENGQIALYTEEPGIRVRRSGRGWSVRSDHDEENWRSETTYRVTVPPSMSVNVSAVNGAVTVGNVTSPVELTTVNGKISLTGARRDAKLNTVNGTIAATFSDLPKGARVETHTVNGSIVLTLPAKAGFRLEGHTMSGEILSTFALPVTPAPEVVRESEESRAAREKIRAEQRKIRAEIKKKEKDKRKASGDEEDAIVIDLSELNEAMAELNREMGEMSRELGREMSHITINLNRQYEGTVGDGGATVSVSNLNGKILVLAEGTTEAEAKKLTSARATRVVTVPPVPNVPRIVIREHPAPAPAPPVPPVPPAPGVAPVPPVAPDPWGRSIRIGDVSGDYAPAIASGDVTVGKVAGHATIASRSGQIHLAGAGKGAELSTAGGDIRVESVTGDLKATTFGGDIRAGSVSGDTRLETSGGDVVVRSAGGSVSARTGGGDVVLKKVRGPVTARTSGGSITCEITSTSAAGGELATSGGDVTVILPANYKADVEIQVTGHDLDSDTIAVQFPEISVSRKSGRVVGEGKLNGGGPKLLIRSSSGVVTVKKGPAA